jgi:hypothetical protein
MAYRAVGPETRDEINPGRIRHDMRRKGERFAELVAQAEVSIVIFLFLLFAALLVPAIADLSLVLGGILYFVINKAQLGFSLPIKVPRHAARIDPHERHPGNGKPMQAMGTFYLGNDRQTGAEIWLSNRDAGVHFLCLGTTGSGKTELLLGLCQNALNLGSGFLFVDGKAQDKIAFKIMDLVRARGRDDDFMCLNFMTGAKDIIGPQPSKITNTMNPFSYGSASMISQIVVGLMSSGGGGDDMWKDRAISFVEAVSPPLTYLRDYYGVMLDVNKYRQYFELERLEELAWKGADMYPGLGQVLEGLQNYLLNLPAYDKNKYGKKNQAEDTKLQHGFITMQLVRAFTSLADTYGHIVRVPLGECFFPDLVKERRILVVMLPSLEKTPSETANIGKIIVTALRNIMAESLGAKLEGDRKSLENEAGRKLLAPYVVILDEYGYYAVKGFAVAFAQARSLGFVCVVGGQDLASFQKESKEEAVSICGNALRLDEPVLTPGGYRRMGDLKVGDYVIHQNGYPTRILGVFPQGDLALYRIAFADGRSMEVSGDHLWEVAELGSNASVLSTEEIMNLRAEARRVFIPLYGPDQEFDAVIAARDRLRRLLDQSFAKVGGASDLVVEGNLSHAAEITKLARALGGWARLDVSAAGVRSLRLGGRPLMSTLAVTAEAIDASAEQCGLEITSVVPLGITAACQCIKVESPDGLFVAGDHLVTHNTRIKLFGSIEDPGETMKFAVDTGGKAMVAKAGQYEFDTGLFSPSFMDQGNVNFDVIDRIDPSDIKVQKEGEFTVVWGPYVIRTKCYFVDPVQVSKVRLNHFVGVHPPTKQQLNEIDVAVSGLLRRISAGNLNDSVQSDEIEEIAAAAVGLAQAKVNSLGVLEQSICTLLAVGMEREIHRKRFTAAVETKGQSGRTPDTYRQISGMQKPVPDPMAVDYSIFPGGLLPEPGGADPDVPDYEPAAPYDGGRAGYNNGAAFESPLSPDDAVPMGRDPSVPGEQMSVFVPRRKSGFAADVFGSAPESERGFADAVQSDESLPLLDYHRTYKGLQEIKRGLGSTEEEAGAAARATVKSMEDATRYPQSVPKEKSGDEVEDLLKGAISALEESET